jgi:hypothetical protein
VLDANETTVGTAVSNSIVSAEAACEGFPLRSVQTPRSDEIDAVPEVAAVGVKVAVYVTPEPDQADIVPPLIAREALPKVVEVSLRVAVIVVVWPLSNVERLLVNVTVGLE